MAGEVSKLIKQKVDAMERINKGDMSPSIYEGATGETVYIDPSLYTQPFLPGKNITFGVSGDSKTINAVMNLFAGSNITISEPDANGQVTITGTIGGKSIDITNLVDGYVVTWDDTNQKFILAEAASPLAQATETELGGVKAKEKTTETGEVAIDPATGKLYAPSSGGSGTYVAIGIVDGGDPDSTYEDVPIPGILPTGGTSGQILSKVDDTDYNAQWIDKSSGGGTSYSNPIDEPPETPNIMDDEFDGVILDPKWSWVNQGTALASLGSGALRIDAPNGGVICRGIVQLKPSSNDFTITMKHLGSSYWGAYSKTGILISESLTGKQLGIWHSYDGGWRGLMTERFNNPNSRSSFGYNGASVLPIGGYIKVRVYYTTAWVCDIYYSLNGFVWVLSVGAIEIGFVPGYVGLGLDFEFNYPGHYWMCDWFRVMEVL